MIKSKISCFKCKNENCLIKISCSDATIKGINAIKIIDSYPKKQLVFHEKNIVFGIYFIQTWIVKVYKEGAFNKNQIVRISSKGNVLGHRGLINTDVYPVSAQTLTTCAICYFPKAYFLKLLETENRLVINLMSFYANELNQIELNLRDMASFTVREKVAKALLFFIDKFGLNSKNEIKNIEIISRQEISETVGLTSNQVTKILNEFKEDGLIKTHGKKIKIVALTELRNILPS